VLGSATLIAALALASPARAATILAASPSQADVQAAVDKAKDGDTVSIPAGTRTWSDKVSWKDKSIQVLGAGKDVTIISCQQCFSITSTASTSAYSKWRLSGMTLQGAAPSGTVITIWDNVGSWHYGWRIDHLKLSYPGAGSGYGVFIGGPTYGLIDHSDWIWGNGMAVIISAQLSDEWPGSATTPQGGYLASQPLDLGTEKAVYLEDNTFTSTVSGGCAAYDTSSGGGRVVFRHNVLTGCMYYDHWTRNVEIGGLLHEIYANKFIGNTAYSAYPIRLESGTGVIFNNTITGFSEKHVVLDERRGFYESDGAFGACDGTKAWDGNAGDPAAPGWPCLGQIGRAPGKTMAQITGGSKQVSAPLTLWNNGAEDGCRTGGACTNILGVSVWDGSAKASAYVKATPHPNGEVDYVLNGSTPKPGYTPFTYPHPLQGVAPSVDAGHPGDAAGKADGSAPRDQSPGVEAGRAEAGRAEAGLGDAARSDQGTRAAPAEGCGCAAGGGPTPALGWLAALWAVCWTMGRRRRQ